MKQGRTITASDFRKTRQKALAEELLKPKYQACGFSIFYREMFFRLHALTISPLHALTQINSGIVVGTKTHTQLDEYIAVRLYCRHVGCRIYK